MLDTLPYGVVYDPEHGEIVGADDPFCGLVGRSAETLVGASLDELVVGDATARSLVGSDSLTVPEVTRTLTAEF